MLFLRGVNQLLLVPRFESEDRGPMSAYLQEELV